MATGWSYLVRWSAATALAALLLPARPATADPTTADGADEAVDVDVDGDGDIDADDAALLDSEVISIEDKSDGQKQAESARAVTVVDLHKAHERTADLGEVLSRTQGLQVRRTGGLGSATRFSLDGLYDDQIRFFYDGVPLPYSGWGGGIGDVPVDLVQRVDVYRGVVPISLGADALGGAIDLVSDPSYVSRASLSYQLGSFGTHRASASLRARDAATGVAVGVNLFVDRARNDYPIDVEVVDERGKTTAATVRRFHDAYTAGGVIAEAGVVNRGAVKRALVRGFFTQMEKDIQSNVVMSVPYGEAEAATDTRGGDVDVVVESAHATWKARVIGGGIRTRTVFTDLSDGVFDWYGHRVGDRALLGETGSASNVLTRTDGLFARATVDHALAPTQTLRLAVAPTFDQGGGTDFLDPNPAGRDPVEARRDLATVVSGVEHELHARGDKLQNIAFVKHYFLHAAIEHVEPGFRFMPVTNEVQRFGVGDSARYLAAPGVIAKASYEWATRMPSAPEMFGDGILVLSNLDLKPERSHNLNASVHVDRETRVGAFGGEVAGFARLVGDLIFQVGDAKTSQYQNVWSARVVGVEGTFGWIAPGEWIAVQASGTLQDIRNSSPEGPFAEFDGERIPNRPSLLGAISASTRRRGVVVAGDDVSLFASSRYVDEYYRGWESAGLVEFKQTIPSQLVHGAGITYALRGAMPLVFTFEASNLTDARVYDSFGVQRPGRSFALKVSGEL